MILFFKDKIIKISLILSLIFNLLTWVLFYFRIPIQVEPIVMRYNIYVGINLIGEWWQIYYLSGFGLLIILLNFILAKKIFKKDKLPAQWLAIVCLICQLIILTYGVLIVIMNS